MPTASSNHTSRAAALLITLFSLFWLWFATRHDLVQDEAYYWQWSRHLAAGYYDGPPLVAYVIRLGTLLLGSTVLGVRLGAVVCAAVAAGFLYKLGTELFGRTVGLIALVAALVNPLFGGGATLMTLDPVQLCFWSLCAWASWRALQTTPDTNQSWKWWLLAGALAGLTALAKLNGLLILPSVLVFALIEPTARPWLRKPQPYTAVILALLIFAPFVYWNHAHGNAFWIHINAMGSRTDHHAHTFTLKYFGDFVGAQAGLISPLLFLTYLWMLITSLRRPDVSPALRYAWSLSAVVFIATCLLSFKSRVEANWAVTCYLTGFILAAYCIAAAWQNRPGRIWHTLSLGLAAVLTLLLYVSTLNIYGPHIKVLDNRTNELYGWKDMAARVQTEQAAMGDDPFVFGINYRMPSELAFYLPNQPETYSLFLHDRASQYMFWENEQDLIGRDAILVNDTENPDHLADCRAVFARVTVEPPLKIYPTPYEKPIRTIQIFRCYDFKGYNRPIWQHGW